MAFQEGRAREAADHVRDVSLYEPYVLPFELATVAWKKARREPGQTRAIREQLGQVLSMPFIFVSLDHVDVFNLALKTGLTVYDASYLAAARRVGATLVTFDRALQAAWTAGP